MTNEDGEARTSSVEGLCDGCGHYDTHHHSEDDGTLTHCSGDCMCRQYVNAREARDKIDAVAWALGRGRDGGPMTNAELDEIERSSLANPYFLTVERLAALIAEVRRQRASNVVSGIQLPEGTPKDGDVIICRDGKLVWEPGPYSPDYVSAVSELERLREERQALHDVVPQLREDNERMRAFITALPIASRRKHRLDMYTIPRDVHPQTLINQHYPDRPSSTRRRIAASFAAAMRSRSGSSGPVGAAPENDPGAAWDSSDGFVTQQLA